MFTVFWVLLHTVHIIYSVITYLQEGIALLISAYKQRTFFGFGKEYFDQSTFERIKTYCCFDRSFKYPKHVALIVSDRVTSSIDVNKFINWCIAAKIHYVSVYDCKGILQKNVKEIEKKFIQLKPQMAEKIEWNCHLIDSTDKTLLKIEKISSDVSESNSVIQSSDYHKIQFLSYGDGKQKIVDCIKSMVNKKYLTQCSMEELQALLDSTLSTGFPDLDLAIVVGSSMCSYGLLPWHTKVTEFFTVPANFNASFETFKSILIKFSKSEQRYGR
ncbi:hypothetical protein TKK_0007016 [Trichogramma kaykai]|uniref:ditrans,polycis-polyprenyl diphosphate synthase [(2E,6E)-farnesyldiphosphate specific] n=1 Tax=Trichogramma kaykai TaxID=54128 RepID=A0ABD2X9L9_9HYME